MLFRSLQEVSADIPARAMKPELSPSVARIEWIRKQLSWIMGRKYSPSRVVAQLKGLEPVSASAEGDSKAEVVGKKQTQSSFLKNHYSKRRIYRWRCKSCRMFGQSKCPRCRLDLEPSQQ